MRMTLDYVLTRQCHAGTNVRKVAQAISAVSITEQPLLDDAFTREPLDDTKDEIHRSPQRLANQADAWSRIDSRGLQEKIS